MSDKQDTIDKIRAFLERHRYIVRAELFGSLARGDSGHDSDVNLLVEFDENRPKGFRAFSLDGELETVLGRKVDIVQRHLMHDIVLENAHDDLELIYERDKRQYDSINLYQRL
jgi:hypothetical protein